MKIKSFKWKITPTVVSTASLIIAILSAYFSFQSNRIASLSEKLHLNPKIEFHLNFKNDSLAETVVRNAGLVDIYNVTTQLFYLRINPEKKEVKYVRASGEVLWQIDRIKPFDIKRNLFDHNAFAKGYMFSSLTREKIGKELEQQEVNEDTRDIAISIMESLNKVKFPFRNSSKAPDENSVMEARIHFHTLPNGKKYGYRAFYFYNPNEGWKNEESAIFHLDAELIKLVVDNAPDIGFGMNLETKDILHELKIDE